MSKFQIIGRLDGFDSNNNTIRIPSPKTMPPFMVGETIKKDVKLYTLTGKCSLSGIALMKLNNLTF